MLIQSRVIILVITSKVRDFISLQNALLVKNVFGDKFSSAFVSYFKKLNTQHLHATRSAINQSAIVPKVNKETHRISSIKGRSVEIWNKLQKALPVNDRPNLTRPKAKEQITTTLLKSYLSPYIPYWSKATALDPPLLTTSNFSNHFILPSYELINYVRKLLPFLFYP